MGTVVFTILLIACLRMRPVVSGPVFSTEVKNTSAKPCEDFYEYACAKWREETFGNEGAIPTYLKEGQTKAEVKVARYLQKGVKETDSQPVKWAKIHFKECMNLSTLNETGMHPLANVVNSASQFGWNILGQNPENDWVAVHNSYCRLTGEGALLTVEVGPDEHFEKNVLIISPTEELFLRKISKSNPEDIHEYEKFLTDIWTAYNKERDHLMFSPNFVEGAIKNVLAFRQAIIEKENLTQRAPDMTVMTLSNLEEHTRRNMKKKYLDWPRFLRSIFKNVGDFKFNESTIVYIRRFNYVKIIMREIELAPTKVLLNHIHYHFLERFIRYSSSDMNARFYEVLKRPLPKRWVTCISSNAMRIIVNFIYVKNFLDYRAMYIAQTIIRDVRENLKNEISNTNWIGRQTAHIAMLKLDRMRGIYGHEFWYTYHMDVTRYYYFRMTIRKNYFNNILDFESMSYGDALRKLGRPFTEGFNKQLTDLFDINAAAAYNYPTNTLMIPPVCLRHIQINDDRWHHVNYATFGTVVGYLLSRSLDSLGRQYDANGNRRNWWGNKTLTEYNRRLQCYLKTFDRLKAIFEAKLNINFTQVDGKDYLEEMVAEYMGLAAAHASYRGGLAKLGKYRTASSAANHDKYFFDAYATGQCEVLIGTDAYMQQRLRVNTAVSNMHAFANAFHCKENDPMNPSEKCKFLNENVI